MNSKKQIDLIDAINGIKLRIDAIKQKDKQQDKKKTKKLKILKREKF
ncbi:MAG: hypothetical protein WAV23_02950 [Minisyncoccia bacterium]